MEVSCIIPCHNHANYLPRAIQSASTLPEISEVIVIDDYSTDDSLEIALRFSKDLANVVCFRNNGSPGPGNARNVGIQKARSPFISFLDADDYYLPNRFKETKSVITTNGIDGVFEAVGVFKHGAITGEIRCLSSGKVVLFKNLVCGDYGYIHLNGLTLKKSICEQSLFDNDLKLTQDTDFIWRIAHLNSLVPAKYNGPVAYRTIHEKNRINDYGILNKYRIKLVTKWLERTDVDRFSKRCLIRRLVDAKIPENIQRTTLLKVSLKTMFLIKYFMMRPRWF